MSKVILFGTGRGADVAFRFLTRDSDHEVCGFAADKKHLDRDTFHGLPAVEFETVEQRFPPDRYKMLVLLGYQGMNGLRAEKYRAAKAKGYGCISYVNSHFYRAEDLDIGENCFILDNQSISLDVKIGNNVVVAAQSGVMHHISDGQKWFGSPAQPDRKMKRQLVALHQLPDLLHRIKDLEQFLARPTDAPKVVKDA